MKALKIALAATAALSVAAPAFAQYQQYQPTDQYRRDMRDYQANQAQYQDQQADYAQARADYEARRARYERERARYDARYGYGAYARVYGPAPVWDSAYYDRDRDASAYGRNASYVDPCASKKTNGKVAGGVIGALAGAALGSNVAANGRGTEGAVLGAVVGGAIGASVGNAAAKARCDEAGYYYNYADTMPYRESRGDRYARSGEYDYGYYQRQRCRLAPAPNDRYGDVRYVRVCPDGQGRYRITG
jgi:uncharacterized protein YcfJ